jgi:pyrimidine operon attenuation protein/uracil phosphoribosyltransferase
MNKILDQEQINQKITRIAHEIIENTTEFQELIICGIKGNGVIIAEKISEIIRVNSDLLIQNFEIEVNKSHPLSQAIICNFSSNDLEGKFVLLVDDVLNSGKTMQYALTKILEQETKTIKTVAMVDRLHRRFPIKCDFVGLTLSTTIEERVELDFSTSNAFAYLT